MAETLIETVDLSVGYASKALIEHIHFSLQAGEVCSILGTNGAGKSTFLKTLLGLMPAVSGEVLFKQRVLKNYPRAELAKQMAYVPQAQHNVFPFLVKEIVLMGRSAYLKWFQQPNQADKKIAQQALEQLGIGHLAERFYPHLSGGEKQLVLIARALAQQAQILIMDEPTASLDFGNQIRVLEKIKRLQQQNMALMITTHNPQHADFLSENVVIIDKQAGFEQGKKCKLLTPERLAALYNVSPDTLKQHLILHSMEPKHATLFSN